MWQMSHAEELVSEVLSRAVSHTDPQGAAIVAAQANRWRDDNPQTRAVEADLVAQSGPHQPGYRPQISFYNVFEDNLTVLRGGPGDHLFVYDHDLVTLYDGRPAGTPAPVNQAAAWEGNAPVAEALNRLLSGSQRRRLMSIRLHLFEGTRRVAPVIAARHAAHLVSHLVAWIEHDDPVDPVASLFPQLIGLSAEPSQLPDLLADGAPSLRSLVVHGKDRWDQTLELAARLPRLEHLGLWAEDVDADDVTSLVNSPIAQQLTSLEFFGCDYARRFPFDAVLGAETFRRLRRLGLPGHLLKAEVREQFVDRPEVDFVGHDRRSRIAFDVETRGWSEYMR